MTLNDTLPLGNVEDSVIDGNGHQPESDEQLHAIQAKLNELTRKDGSVVTLTPQELGLLQTILRTTTEQFREEQMFRMMDFMDWDEALDHVAAYYEAKDLGMDTSFNVAFMFALCSVNRKGSRNNLIANILDTMQMGTWARSNNSGKKKDDTRNPRSPLS